MSASNEPNPFNLSDVMLRVGEELFHIERAGTDATTAAIASGTGLSVPETMRTLGKMADMHLVETRGIRGDMKSFLNDPAGAMAAAMFGMSALLPSALESRLDYSPSQDDDRVRDVLRGRPRADEFSDQQLAAQLGVPAVRVREAITRLTRLSVPGGGRFRIIVEITFPDVDLESFDSMELLERFTRSLEASETAPGRNVKIRELVSIGFATDPAEYRQWRDGHRA